jgi:hypothetical protein
MQQNIPLPIMIFFFSVSFSILSEVDKGRLFMHHTKQNNRQYQQPTEERKEKKQQQF